MLPYVPVRIITSENSYLGAAYQKGTSCIFLAPKNLKRAVIALVDMSVLVRDEYDTFEWNGFKLPIGTLYALLVEVEDVVWYGTLGIHMGKVVDTYDLGTIKDPTELKDVSIPVKINDILTRVDERYITRL